MSNNGSSSSKALNRHLAPLMPFLNREGVTELCINQPQEIYLEQRGQFNRFTVNELTYDFLYTLALLIAEYNHKAFPAPLLAGSLPTGERIQCVMNPACENHRWICSIRKHQARDVSLEDYDRVGAFYDLKNRGLVSDRSSLLSSSETLSTLKTLYQKKDILGFIKEAILAKQNILISGGTGTGKTTFLNACLKHIPAHERIITVEDTREVKISHPNVAHLLFNEEDKRITALNVFKACLRLRPDRILLSECRGSEVWPYLRAANSGHPGSISTIHADTPDGAIQQLVFMMQQAGSTSDEAQIKSYVQSIIPIIIQLKRCSNEERFMTVSELYFNGNSP